MNFAILSCCLLLALTPNLRAATPPTRPAERLDRGLIALPAGDGRIFLSWRKLALDPADVAFNVYRVIDRGYERLNPQPLRDVTCFLHDNPGPGAHNYTVRTLVNAIETEVTPLATATSQAEPRPYLSIKLDGDYTFQKVAIADLDADGRYDYVIKQPNQNVDPYEKYWKKSPGTFKLEAYNSATGNLLWRYDLGWSIEQGMWYSPYVVFDFDGDGNAEVAVKTGEGDPRDADGRVQSGPEYLSILDGHTGKEITRTDWPTRDDFPSYNYYCRNQIGVACLDGKTPHIIVERGTYNTIKLAAYKYAGGKLHPVWTWNDSQGKGRNATVSYEETSPSKKLRYKTPFSGQGAHCIRAADIDNDGRDEIILGSAVIDDDGKGLWSTGMGHPDHVTVGDLDPTRPGLEIQYGYETRQLKYGICMVDAATGKLLWGIDQPTFHIHSSGLCADIDPDHPGVESYGGERDFKQLRWLLSAQGKRLKQQDMGGLAPRAAWWDADAQRELLINGKLSDYNGSTHPTKIEGSVIAVADVIGDWREEIITTLPGQLRIYSTTIPATDRRNTLMQDPIYRLDVATVSQGYTQVPSITTLPAHE